MKFMQTFIDKLCMQDDRKLTENLFKNWQVAVFGIKVYVVNLHFLTHLAHTLQGPC